MRSGMPGRWQRHMASAAFPVVALAAFAPGGVADAQSPQVFTFDVPASQLPAFAAAIENGTPVGDLRFDPTSNWQTGDFSAPVYRGVLNCHSAPYCTSPNNVTGNFSFLTPHVFLGAWLAGPSDNDVFGGPSSPNRVFWQLLVGGNVVYESPTFTLSPTPTFLGVSYAGAVETVRLASPDGYGVGILVVDDITYQPASTVPEPVTLGLVALGLAGVAGAGLARRPRTTG